MRILKAKMPFAFVGENVKGLLTMGDGNGRDTIFVTCGTKRKFAEVNASLALNFGD